ncbi:hypothetical protein [Pontiella sulfatireligans]|nr:hypothetical protein [Pontiella sulfatireligans]
MVAATVGFGGIAGVARADQAMDQLASDANKSIMVAEVAVDQARIAIENGKQLVAVIPADSPLMSEVKQMLMAAAENWSIAVDSLSGAKESASKISTASNIEVAKDYKLLAQVNSRVALSGAKVVQTSLLFVDAVAGNKGEALDIIRMAMQDSLAATSQVQFNYERVKALILGKYSN